MTPTSTPERDPLADMETVEWWLPDFPDDWRFDDGLPDEPTDDPRQALARIAAQVADLARERDEYRKAWEEVTNGYGGEAAINIVARERDEAWRVAAEQTRMERDRAEAAEAERDRLAEALREVAEEVAEWLRSQPDAAHAKSIERITRAALAAEPKEDPDGWDRCSMCGKPLSEPSPGCFAEVGHGSFPAAAEPRERVVDTDT